MASKDSTAWVIARRRYGSCVVASGGVTAKRMNKDEFFGKLAAMDRAALAKVLWALYWRGSAAMRERIEAEIDPRVKQSKQRAMKESPDAALVLSEVSEFVALARAGSYMAGDRRVSPRERSRWRFTFRRLAEEALGALACGEVEQATAAVTRLIDLACGMRSYDYFRSEDPVEAARFVVSDATAALWARMREEYGFSGFAERAAGQLLRWESGFGWTRRGDGWVSAHETSLALVVARLIPVPDLWAEFADHYLDALDGVADGAGARAGRGRGTRQRAEDLSEWHLLLVEHLAGSGYEDRLDRLAGHPGLAGPEHTYLQARIADERGDRERARRLVHKSLTSLPGHRDFHDFAREIGAPIPARAKEAADRLHRAGAPGTGS